MKITKDQKAALAHIAEGWRPLVYQVGSAKLLERHGLVRIDWGPDGTRDANKLCLYITDKGQEALK